MYGITGTHAEANEEVRVSVADTWSEAHTRAEEARELDWNQVRVVPGYNNTCHSPLGYSAETPVCALGAGHADKWHETKDGALSWYDDDPSRMRVALDEQAQRDSQCMTA